ncbi:MAG: hypothetical protein CMM94_03790 [Rickettsiales bacterium]|nr:hypothetical protein [Rickettsiales bacterium]
MPHPFTPHSHNSSRGGFSLIEMAIVLVVIGLITGGIIAGQSIIRAAEVNSIVAEKNRYTSATAAFKQQYGALPGDFDEATRYWGAAASDSTAGTGTQTRNGDGNGRIDYDTNEMFRYWEQLQNAGLLDSDVSGIANNSSVDAFPGEHVPATGIDGVGAYVYYVDAEAGNVAPTNFYFPFEHFGHVIAFGRRDTNANALVAEFLTPNEMYKLDAKHDDGTPGYGDIMTFDDTYNANCHNDRNSYTRSFNGEACNPIFRGVF